MQLPGTGSILLAAGIQSVAPATPFQSQISPLLHTFAQPVEGLYEQISLFRKVPSKSFWT